MNRPILYPDRVALANFADLASFTEQTGSVTSPTIHSINSFFTNGLSIKLGTEGIQVQHQESAIDIEHITAAGVQIADVVRQSKNCQITMTASAWSMAIEAMLEGKSFDDVKVDADAVQSGAGYTYSGGNYVAPAQDVNNAKGVTKGDSIYRSKLSLLFRCPLPTGGYLYFLAPKVVVRPDNRDTTLLLQQAKPAIVLTCLSLEESEVAPFANLYSEVSQFGLVYKFEIPSGS